MNKRIILSLLCVSLFGIGQMFSQFSVPGSNTMLGGAMVYNDDWVAVDDNGNYINPITAGIYSIQAREDGRLTKVYANNAFTEMCAGLKLNNTYYVISTSKSGNAYISEYSTSTWSRSRHEEIDYVNVPTDLTYDPITKKVYGAFYNDVTQEYDRFCSFSLSMAEATDIAEMDRNIFAIAANDAGDIYAIWGYTGWLIKINPLTGQYEQIGRTGVDPKYINSLTFGSDGLLYWASTSDTGKAALYTINTSTGVATKVLDMPGNAEISGLFAQTYRTPDTAPDVATYIGINFSEDFSTQGQIVFTAPAKTVNGAAITENLNAIVAVNGVELQPIQDIIPGAVVTLPLMTFSEGMQVIDVTMTNATERGDMTSADVWVGEDVPDVVTNLSVKVVGGKPEISWDAPSKGLHNGKIKPQNIRYKIVRMPGNVVVCSDCAVTSFVDDSMASDMAAVYYLITPYSIAKGNGPTSETDKVVVGQGYKVPFVEGFDSQEDFELWSVVDNNGGSTWVYDDGQAHYKYNNENIPGDDWLISPQITLEEGKVYRLSFTSKTASYSSYSENFKVTLGKNANPDEMTVLKEFTSYYSKTPETQSVIVHVEESGDYHIGFYDFSDGKKGWSLYIDNVGMDEVIGVIPSVVNDLNVSPAPSGVLRAMLSFTAPEKDAKGGTLNENVSVTINRNGTLVNKFTDVAPGTALSWTDDEISVSDTYTYSVFASTEYGDGEAVSVSSYVGIDVPGSVSNVSIKEDSDGNALLNWSAPTVGSHGGYFDNSDINYRILRSDGVVVAQNYHETSFVDSNLPVNNSQELIYYVITAYAGSAKGDYFMTESVVFGTPYICPFVEGFAGSEMDNYPWVTESDDNMTETWILADIGQNPSASDQNGDRGLITFRSYGVDAGKKASLSSPKISLTGLTSPSLSFWIYHTADDDAEEVNVAILSPTDGWQMIDDIAIRLGNSASGWQRHTVSLSQYKEQAWIRVAFIATTAGGNNIHLDNISINEVMGNDIELSQLSGPKKIAAGENADYEVTITNIGVNDVPTATVSLASDNKILAQTVVTDIPSGGVAKVVMSAVMADCGLHTVTVSVESVNDDNNHNNAKAMTTDVVAPLIPAPFDLICENRGDDVRLVWKKPSARGVVSDDVESYPDWAIDGIGEWTMADLDHDITYYISKDLDSYPFMSDEKAFQVCNAKSLGINIWDEGTPHSGNKMFMSIACINYVNNDWMISPRLNGKEQTISFFAKSFTLQDTPMERLRVLYSTTDTDPANFLPLHTASYIELPDEWLEYSYVLPDGARYFAINGVSDGGFALFVDDIRYNDLTVPSLDLVRYDVYRNGELIGTSFTEEYVDATNPATILGSTYTVKAVYDKATSNDSEKATLGESGINDVSSKVVVSTSQNMIIVEGAKSLSVNVAQIDGIIVANKFADSNHYTIPVSSGIYVVTVGTDTHKVIVK